MLTFNLIVFFKIFFFTQPLKMGEFQLLFLLLVTKGIWFSFVTKNNYIWHF